jgi:outer membrane protein assembly factor BamB
MKGSASVFCLLFALTLRVEAQWPRFRGPDGNGTAAAAALPLKWSEAENVRWKTAVHGRAWSSPVILENRLWITTASEDGRDLYAVSLDPSNGRIVHDLKLFHVDKPQDIHPFNSYGSPTPVVEPGRVYVTFGSPGTAAIDAASGRVLWARRDIECYHYRGAGSSPVVFRNLLIMHFDGSDRQFVVALDKHSGRTVWQTNRSVNFDDLGPDGKPQGDGDFRKAFATPEIVAVNGQPVLVSIGSKAAYGYDPLTGREIWRIRESSSFSSSATPVYGHGLVFYTTGWNNGQLLAIRPDGAGDVTSTHIVWRAPRAAPKKPSVAIAGDLLYMINDSGILTCLDARTGAVVWTGRLNGNYSASPLVWRDRVYFFSEEGKTTVIEAGRTFKVLAESVLDGAFMASAAVAGNALFLRAGGHVYRIEE